LKYSSSIINLSEYNIIIKPKKTNMDNQINSSQSSTQNSSSAGMT